MYRLKAAILLMLIGYSLTALSAEKALFPRPAALEQDVKFWTHVYTRISGEQGFIHDDAHLNVVYETLSVPKKYTRKKRRALIKRVKAKYVAILDKLASGKRKGLSKTERRVLNLWPKKVSNKVLKAAKQRIRFQRGQSDKFREGLARANAWKPYILKILKKMQLPLEIAVLPHVESSFNHRAYSKIGAAGMWQFTRSTGKLFMRIDDVIDERMDPFLATIAAAKLLKRNHALTGTWPLALTAYNHGAAGMQRAVKTLGSDNIEHVVRKYKGRRFGFASRNFYVSFLAALDIDRNPKKYFKQLNYHPPIDYELLKMPAFVAIDSVLKALHLNPADIMESNPALSKAVWKGYKYIPKGYIFRIKRAIISRAALLAKMPTETMFAEQKNVYPARFHKVKRGQTLSQIAQKYRIRTRDLIAKNGLRNRHKIRIGQVLKVPYANNHKAIASRLSTKAVKKRVVRIVRRSAKLSTGRYRVKAGDTLSKIASRHRISSQRLLALNQLKNKHKIYPGQVLRTQAGTYTVRKGDSLGLIAQRHGKSVRTLLALNKLRNKSRIYPGQTLRLVE